MTNIDELKQYLFPYSATNLRKAVNGGFTCPYCMSGLRKHGTGAFKIMPDGKRFRCFSCGRTGDIFDLVGEIEHIHSFYEKVAFVKENFGGTTPPAVPAQHISKAENSEDYSHYYHKCHRNLHLTTYPQRRGLSPATLERFNIGFDPRWKDPKGLDVPATPRLIIPSWEYGYTSRDIRHNIDEWDEPYKIKKTGRVHLFNSAALYDSTSPVFVVEGEIDAMSLYEVGADAVGLGSVTGVKRFIDTVKEKRPSQPLILALDNDKAGQDATQKLSQELDKLKIPYLIAGSDLYAGLKDANDALLADREGFGKRVERYMFIFNEKVKD